MGWPGSPLCSRRPAPAPTPPPPRRRLPQAPCARLQRALLARLHAAHRQHGDGVEQSHQPEVSWVGVRACVHAMGGGLGDCMHAGVPAPPRPRPHPSLALTQTVASLGFEGNDALVKEYGLPMLQQALKASGGITAASAGSGGRAGGGGGSVAAGERARPTGTSPLLPTPARAYTRAGLLSPADAGHCVAA